MTKLPDLLGALLRVTHSGKAKLAGIRGVEPGSGMIMKALAYQGPLRCATLAEQAGVDPSLITRQSQYLINHGLIIRVPDPLDGRASLLELTPAGEEWLKVGKQYQQEFFSRVFAEWKPADREEFERLLALFIDDFNREFHNLEKKKND